MKLICKYVTLLFIFGILLMIISCRNDTITPVTTTGLWTKSLGGNLSDKASSIILSSDGNIVIAGTTISFGAGDNDIFAAKIDKDSNIIWFKTFGGSGSDEGNSIQQTLDGGYIIAGNTTSFGAAGVDIICLKIDGLGNVVWSKLYKMPINDYGVKIELTSDGGYVICGTSDSFGSGYNDQIVLKIDGSGNIQWAKAYGGAFNDLGASIKPTGDGGYILLGNTYSEEPNGDILLTNLYGDGVIRWAKHYGGGGFDQGNDIQFTTDNGLIIAGYTQSFGLNSGDAYIFKTNASGGMIYSYAIGGGGRDEFNSIRLTAAGGYIACGTTNSFGAGAKDAFIVNLNGLIILNWDRVYGGVNDDETPSIIQRSDGNFIAAGFTNSFGNSNSDIYLLNLNIDGLSCSSEGVNNPTGANPTTQENNSTIIATDVYLIETLTISPVVNQPIITLNKLCSSP